MAKQSKSQRIRTLLAQGKSVKEIVKTVKCHPGLVYQVKSYDKSKAKKAVKKTDMKARGYEKAQVWVKGVDSTSVTPVLDRTTGKQWGAGQIQVMHQPKDYPMPKRNVVQRFFNWLCGG